MRCTDVEFLCDGMCLPMKYLCDGIQQCAQGEDENSCIRQVRNSQSSAVEPSPPAFETADVLTTIVLPTIVICVLMVVGMLFGINKCKEWELDRIMEMRRTRRVVQRLTARLREKNFRTLQKARTLRRRAMLAQEQHKLHVVDAADDAAPPPPLYDAEPPFASGASPPPAYEDALLDEYYYELLSPVDSVASSRRGSAHRRGIFGH